MFREGKLIVIVCILLMIPFGVSALTADFSANVTTGAVPLSVSFTDSSTDSPNNWSWFTGEETYNESWYNITPTSGTWWGARDSQKSVAFPDGTIVLFEGVNSTVAFNDTWRSTDGGASWILANASSGWQPRQESTAVILSDNSIVLMGGTNQASTIRYNDVWRSTDKGSTWTCINASAGWATRYAMVSVAQRNDDSIVLIGGVTTAYQKDVWRSTDKGYTWTQMSSNAEMGVRRSMGLVSLRDGTLLSIGGQSTSATYWADTWKSTNNGATWTNVTSPTASFSKRSYNPTILMPDNSIVILGGKTGTSTKTNDVWRSTNNGTDWVRINASAGWTAKLAHSAVLTNNGSLVVMGGLETADTNNIWSFNPSYSTVQNPVKTYGTIRLYNVTLMASNMTATGVVTKYNYINVTEASSDTTPPQSITGLISSLTDCNKTAFNWTNPLDADFNVMQYWVNNSFIGTTSNTTTSVYLTGLPESSTILFSTHTVDLIGNVNTTWVNATTSTSSCAVIPPADTTPPDSISNLVAATINDTNATLTWTNPTQVDFFRSNFYRGNTWFSNYTNTTTDGYWCCLVPLTTYFVNTTTEDLSGNRNVTHWINISFTTKGAPVASFTPAGTTIGTAPLNVTFTDTSLYEPTMWAYARRNLTHATWELVSTDRNTTVIFPAGNWSVNLSASNAFGSSISTQITWVNVSEAYAPTPPIVDFTRTIPGFTNIYEHYPVYLNDTSFSGITTWNWTVGNATTNGVNVASYTVKDPVWTCPETGQYSVYLNVTNVSGFNSTTRLGYLNCVARVDSNVEIRSDPSTQTIANGTTYLLTSSLNKLEINSSVLELRIVWNPLILSVSNIRGNTSYFSGAKIKELTEYDTTNGTAYFQVDRTSGGFIDASDTYRPFVDYDVKYMNYSQAGSTTKIQHTYFEYYDSATSRAWNTQKFFNTTYTLSPWVITAAFSGTPLTVPVGNNVSFTDASTGYPNRWEWNWGDGNITNSTTQNPSHSYLTPGLKTVTLRSYLWQDVAVYDDETKTNYVNVIDVTPPQSITSLSATETHCQNISWGWTNPSDTDYSYVYVMKNNGWVGNYSSPQAAATWLSLSELTDYTFSSKTVDTSGNMNGTFVNATVQTGACGTAPVSSFTPIGSTEGVEPLSVQFTDTSVNSPTLRGWFFQDVTGNNTIIQFNSTSATPIKIFNAGNFTIKLNVTNAYGSNVSVQSTWINVSAYVPPLFPPVAAFSANNRTVCQFNGTHFTDASTNSPNAWLWQFGDGSESILQSPSHQYDILGVFPVNMRATNDDGFDWENKSGYITVDACLPIPKPMVIAACSGSFMAINGSSPADEYNWDFGDGFTGSGVSTTHLFPWGRGYTITLSTITGGVTSNVSTYYGGCEKQSSSAALIPI